MSGKIKYTSEPMGDPKGYSRLSSFSGGTGVPGRRRQDHDHAQQEKRGVLQVRGFERRHAVPEDDSPPARRVCRRACRRFKSPLEARARERGGAGVTLNRCRSPHFRLGMASPTAVLTTTDHVTREPGHAFPPQTKPDASTVPASRNLVRFKEAVTFCTPSRRRPEPPASKTNEIAKNRFAELMRGRR